MVDAEYADDDPVVVDMSLETYNARDKVLQMYEYVTEQRAHYRGNHIMIPMGADFAYSNAYMNF